MSERAPEPPRERRFQKVIRRILDAATRTIVAGGVDALSMNRLAATLDYTPGALYRYFPSKDALVATLLIEVIEEVGSDVARAVASRADSPPLARVVACARAWRRFADADPHRFALLAMMLASPRLVLASEDHTKHAIGALLAATRPLAVALAEASADGTLAATPRTEPGTDRAALVFAGLLGVLLLRKQAQRVPDLVDLDRLFAGMLRSLLAGWGATAAALDAAFAEPEPPPAAIPFEGASS
ncbi:MAG: helix-turn-helix domain-containing protein [Myxococcota bacterium]